MGNDLLMAVYNPDVLTCLANLSNDEVFTPPQVVNDMLDMLPQELFSDPNATFLDPACKSGVFLREIAKRLIKGLADEMPNLQERLDHIYHNQLFGIAITELTGLASRRSLYCSKYPNRKYSISHFDNVQGNVRFKNIEHAFKNGKCMFCGASENVFGKVARHGLENHAYEFIHTTNPEEIFNMKFDVIIGNPPYQIGDGGAQASATPIYNFFVEQAKKLNPRYLAMIIPSRWFGGGKGLDDFRNSMISDKKIRVLHDFLNAKDCFGNGVEIKGGVCYFLWDREHEGECKIYTHLSTDVTAQNPRYLQEQGSDVLIRFSEGVSVFNKVKAFKEKTMDSIVSSQKPFGLRTFVHGSEKAFEGSVKLYERGGVGYIDRNTVSRNQSMIEQEKVYISAAYNAGDVYPHQVLGKPIYGETGSCCTETYEVIGPFLNGDEAKNCITYIKTKFFRFLVLLKKASQHAPSTVFSFVPIQDFSHPWNDQALYSKYGVSDNEIKFIDSMIKSME